MQAQMIFSITDASRVGETRRAVTAAASKHGLNETMVGKVALVVTEVATNLIKHAAGGQLFVRMLERGSAGGIEILALDKGPGMANPGECLRDGYSTTGSAGTGLGAITRFSSLFDISSTPRKGTALLAQVWSDDRQSGFKDRGREVESKAAFEVGAVCVAQPGEDVCGDAWTVAQHAGRSVIFVADGLGHGLGAAEASQAAVRIFRERATLAPADILQEIHAGLRSTRGAAVAIAAIDAVQQRVTFAGIGNIAGEIWTPAGSRKMVSHNGTLGHTVRKVQEFTYPWSKGALLIMHSDGIATHWTLDPYAGLTARHPSLIAGVLYRDFQRGRDDATVVVVKEC